MQVFLVPLDALLGPQPLTEAEAVGPMKAQGGASAQALFPNRPTPLLTFLRNRLIEKGIAAGASRADAERAADMLNSERPIVDWFLNDGWKLILEAFLALLTLILEKPAAA